MKAKICIPDTQVLLGMKVKALLVLAKSLNILGRHELNKLQLIEAIVQADQSDTDQNEEPKAESMELDGEVEMQSSNCEGDIDCDLSKAISVLDSQASSSWSDESNHCEEVNADIHPELVGQRDRSRKDYVSRAVVGNIVAFTLGIHKGMAMSGMIEEIREKIFVIRTKTGVKFDIPKEDVIWVKTNQSWPKGVYEMLKASSTMPKKEVLCESN